FSIYVLIAFHWILSFFLLTLSAKIKRVPPRMHKRSRSHTASVLSSKYNGVKFVQQEAADFYQTIQGHVFIPEHDFDPASSFNDEM
ncbi:hypothetical protein J1N35_029281, partial [Gossypium stocksii]